jgi:hypothetical protein
VPTLEIANLTRAPLTEEKKRVIESNTSDATLAILEVVRSSGLCWPRKLILYYAINVLGVDGDGVEVREASKRLTYKRLRLSRGGLMYKNKQRVAVPDAHMGNEAIRESVAKLKGFGEQLGLTATLLQQWYAEVDKALQDEI